MMTPLLASNQAMTNPDESDDKTLALLVALADLSGQSHGVSHIAAAYARAIQQVEEYRKEKAPPFKYQGF
ncbi:MAG: hypothetical protein M3O31_00380 [Acidobacteriota bacterium]|nr:hypothetical protein [Acidobacteriota bacterium]